MSNIFDQRLKEKALQRARKRLTPDLDEVLGDLDTSIESLLAMGYEEAMEFFAKVDADHRVDLANLKFDCMTNAEEEQYYSELAAARIARTDEEHESDGLGIDEDDAEIDWDTVHVPDPKS